MEELKLEKWLVNGEERKRVSGTTLILLACVFSIKTSDLNLNNLLLTRLKQCGWSVLDRARVQIGNYSTYQHHSLLLLFSLLGSQSFLVSSLI